MFPLIAPWITGDFFSLFIHWAKGNPLFNLMGFFSFFVFLVVNERDNCVIPKSEGCRQATNWITWEWRKIRMGLVHLKSGLPWACVPVVPAPEPQWPRGKLVPGMVRESSKNYSLQRTKISLQTDQLFESICCAVTWVLVPAKGRDQRPRRRVGSQQPRFTLV